MVKSLEPLPLDDAGKRPRNATTSTGAALAPRRPRRGAWIAGGLAGVSLGILAVAVGILARGSSARLHDSRMAERTALHRGEIERDRGRLAAAEAVLAAAMDRPGPLVTELRHNLMQVFWEEGRLDEARALIEQNWEEHRRTRGPDSDPAISNLRAHLSLDLEVYAVDRVRTLLDQAGAAAPDDDRVWLGRANLAIRTGRFEEARPWLDRCLVSRPEDPAVWSTTLELAMALDDVALAGRAARHLAVARMPADRVAYAHAWFAAGRGDAGLERTILEERLAREPGDARALERLSELEIVAGRADRTAELRRRKTELDRARRLYAIRVSSDFRAEARELAGLAEALGRRFEARAFLEIVVKQHPEDRAALDRLAVLERARLDERPDPSQVRLSELVGALPSASVPGNRAQPGATVAFHEDAGAVGLSFAFENGRTPAHQLPETMSGGVGLLDFDGDGWLDVYAVQGGRFPPDPAAAGDRLFRNRGDGTFEDVTRRSGLSGARGGYGHGVAVGDVDNDGRPDLFVTRFGSYALYHNCGDSRFEDMTDQWGLGGDRGWPTSAAFADLDGDGDLDLYVGHYVAWDSRNPRACGNKSGGPVSYCVPHLLEPVPDHVFRNDGGRFRDVTREAGFTDPDGRGLGVLIADLDDDDRMDVFVANDGTANFLFRNRGAFRFEETGLGAGVAANAEGGYQAGMGIAGGDLDGDGRIDLVVTNFYGESSSFFRNLGGGLFADHTSQIGLREATRYLLGFGTALIDADNDGYLDLATANGHVNDVRPIFPYAMPAQLLMGSPAGRLVDASGRAGPAWSVPRIGRGLAAGDIDNDGRIDLVIVDQDGPLALFHNRTGADRSAAHFVTLRLEGTASNRDAVGAKVVVEARGRRQTAQRVGGGSYQSANDTRLHFGLGPATTIDSVEVRWPSDRVDRYQDLAADAGYHLREGDSLPRTLKGFDGRR